MSIRPSRFAVFTSFLVWALAGAACGGGGGSDPGGSGGSTGGTLATGGSPPAGGTSGITGGATGTAGLNGSGGAKATGGSPGSGGASGGKAGTTGAAGGGGGAAAGTHLYTQGSDLYTSCGEKVLLRGLNQMSIWSDPSGSSYPAIASFGSNAIRIVYTESGTAAGLDTLLTKAEDNKLIPIAEIHDATGMFAAVPAAVSWWTQSSVVSVVQKHQKWMMLNVANEAGDNNVTDSTFQATYTQAITSIRNAGIVVPIVIDGSGWGQKVEQLLSVAPALLTADPQKNVVFSWHEYTGGSQENSRITTSFEKSKSLGVVLINGEFASAGAGGGCTENIPYQWLLSEAQRIGIGWLAWSWDNTNSDCKSGSSSVFDMTTDITSAAGLVSGWATNVIRDDPNSIKNTSFRHCEWK